MTKMNRLTVIFIALLALATLSAGGVYQSAETLMGGRGGVITLVAFALSAALLGFTLLVLGRMVYLTAPQRTSEEL